MQEWELRISYFEICCIKNCLTFPLEKIKLLRVIKPQNKFVDGNCIC